MDERVVDEIVASALDREVRSVRYPREGSVADTSLLDLAGGEPSRAVCKLGGASVWTGDVIEPLVIDRVRDRTDLPVPDVLATGSLSGTRGSDPDRWALYGWVDGTNPGPRYPDLEPAVRARIVADAGDALGRLHAAEIPIAGGAHADRIGGLAREGDALVLRAPDGWHAIDPGPPVSSLAVPLAGDSDCRPVLAHGDFQPSNLLVDEDGGVAAVLDWGNAHVTHATYALARAEARFVDLHARRLDRDERDRLRETFRERYREHAHLDRRDVDAIPTYKLLWLAQSIANYGRIARSRRGRTQLRRQARTLRERVRERLTAADLSASSANERT